MSANDPLRGFNPYQTDPWLRKQFKDNVGYDKLVRTLVIGNPADPGAQQFLQTNEFLPEKMAARTARVAWSGWSAGAPHIAITSSPI